MTAKEALHLWIDCLDEGEALALLDRLQDDQHQPREPLTAEEAAVVRESVERTRTGPVLTTAELREFAFPPVPRSPRVMGRLQGEFSVPADFNDDLPHDLLAATEGFGLTTRLAR